MQARQAKFSFLLVVRMLYMSIVLGESQRDVRARPYFRGRGVCYGADIEPGACQFGRSTAALASLSGIMSVRQPPL